MLEVNLETVHFVKRSLYWHKKIFIAVYAFTTSPAHQVMMMTLFGMVLDKMVTQFAFEHAAKFLEELQCTIYS